MIELLLAIVVFVGTHFVLSHPLRAPLVRRFGEQGFMGVYSLVALIALIWVVTAYRGAPSAQLWIAPVWLRWLGYLVMIDACILLAGSLIAPNPALTMMGGALQKSTHPTGVMLITRHPMMWAIGLWAMVHVAVSGRLETLILAGGMGVLALVGAKLQDGKKALQLGEAWAAYAAHTSYWPGGAQIKGRLPLRTFWPGWVPVLAGCVLYGLFVYVHGPIIGRSTGLY